MNLNIFGFHAKTTAVYPQAKTGSLSELTYLALGLAGESGEVANKIKKLYRDGDSQEKREKLLGELGDVLWYWVRLCDALGFDPDVVMSLEVLNFNTRRKYTESSEGGFSELTYITLGLVGESGEVANQVKNICRDRNTKANQEKIYIKLGSLMWYWVMLCNVLQLDPELVMQYNLDKLSGRKSRGMLGGDGDLR